MFELSESTILRCHQDRPSGRAVRRTIVRTPPEDLANHFRSHFPILVDGALPRASDQGHLLQQARESLARGTVDPGVLPAALLREVLETVKATATPTTRAGLTTVGPRRARVWWDAAALDRVDDVLTGLDKPRAILRFYDITGLDPSAGSWNDSFDLDVAVADKGMSVDFWAADRVYVVELGLLHADGRFVRLARTNTAALPREEHGHGPADAGVRSRLTPRSSRFHAHVAPDAQARQWIDARADSPDRDVEAESIIHMLYRAFLLEGPRALRNAPRLACRDAAVLGQEFAERSRRRPRAMVTVGVLPTLVVARLDDSLPTLPVVLRYPVIPLAVAKPIPAAAVLSNAFAAKPAAPAVHLDLAARSGLVQPADDAERVVATYAEPVFKAAATLREQLANLNPKRSRASKKPVPRISRFGSDDAKRFAKAGVRIERMALTLEGRMRPGARLKVAGKTVRADAEGRFSLECVVAGGKSSIPLLAGGDARSMINVEWETRPARAKV